MALIHVKDVRRQTTTIAAAAATADCVVQGASEV